LPRCHFGTGNGLTAEGLAVRRGRTLALENIDFAVEPGEWVAVVGPNGSGKSTLLLALKGVLQPERGRVLAGGEPLRPFDSRVGLVLANPEDQGIAPVVEDDIAFGLECLGLPTQDVEARVRSSLRAVGLEDLRSASTHILSGGQGQKLALAAVLALGARWLLLDEATSMLSPWERDGLLSVVASLKPTGIGVVQVTHQGEELPWADRVVALERGAVAFEGAPVDYFSWPGSSLPVPPYETLRRRVSAAGSTLPAFPELAAWLSR
jgi:energy-coupling factor transport system ATP-binding protein